MLFIPFSVEDLMSSLNID